MGLINRAQAYFYKVDLISHVLDFKQRGLSRYSLFSASAILREYLSKEEAIAVV